MVKAILFVCFLAISFTVVHCQKNFDLCSLGPSGTNRGVISNRDHPEYVKDESCKCNFTSDAKTTVEINVMFKTENKNAICASKLVLTNGQPFNICPSDSTNASTSLILNPNQTSSIALYSENEDGVSYYITYKSTHGNLTFKCGGWVAIPVLADGLALNYDAYSGISTGVLVGAIVGSLVGVGILILILVFLAIKLGYCKCPGPQKEEQFDNPLSNTNRDYPDRSRAVHVGKINNAYVGSPTNSNTNISGKNHFFSNSFDGQQNPAYDLSYDSSWDHSHNTSVPGILKISNGGTTPSDTSSDNDNKKNVSFAPMPEREKKKKKQPPKVTAFSARNFGIPQPKKRTRSPRRNRSPSPRHSPRTPLSDDEVDRGAPPSKKRNNQPVEPQVQQQRGRPVGSAPSQTGRNPSPKRQPERQPERQQSSNRKPDQQKPNRTSAQQPAQQSHRNEPPKSILRSPKQPKSQYRPQSQPAPEKPFAIKDDDVIYADMSNYQDPYLIASKEALNNPSTRSLPNFLNQENPYEAPPPVKGPVADQEPVQYRPRSNSQPSVLKNKGLAPSMGTYAPDPEDLYALPKKGKHVGPNQPTHKRAPQKEKSPPVKKQQPVSPKENIYEELPDPDTLPPRKAAPREAPGAPQPQYEDRPPSGIVLETPNGGTNRQSRSDTRQPRSNSSSARTPSPKNYSPHMMVRLGLATPNESIETDI